MTQNKIIYFFLKRYNFVQKSKVLCDLFSELRTLGKLRRLSLDMRYRGSLIISNNFLNSNGKWKQEEIKWNEEEIQSVVDKLTSILSITSLDWNLSSFLFELN